MNSVQYAATLIKPEYKHVLEFGVYQGYTVGLIREALDDSYKVFGFDSFEGLPEDWENTTCMKGHFSTGGKIPDIEGVKFFKGWFEDTIPQYLEEADTIGLLHVDCDLYSSTKTIFDNLHPYIKKGTIIVFDEWCYHADPKYDDHEQKAFYEYVDDHDVKFMFINFYDEQNPTERKIIKIV
jgi:predicted O-methyltransferase YrrM